MKHFTRLLSLFLIAGLLSSFALGQVTGDYRSAATGYWNVAASWETYDGAIWTAAATTPGATNNVYIQKGHEITLVQNEACNTLNICARGSSAKVTSGTFTLSVSGNLRAYGGEVGTIPGTDTTGVPAFINTTAGGKIRLVGTTRQVTTSTSWAANPQFWTLEMAPNTSTDTLKFATNIKAGTVIISSGVAEFLGNGTLRADSGAAGKGKITVSTGATLKFDGNATIGRTGTASTGYFDSLTVNGTIIFGGANCSINANNIRFAGTVIYDSTANQNFVAKTPSGGGAATPNTYQNLFLRGSGVKTLSTNTTVNGTFSLQGTATLNLGTSTITYGASAIVTYAGSATQTTGPEFPAAMGTNVRVSNVRGVTLNESKTISGTGKILYLTTGPLVTGANTITVDSTASISRSSGVVVGNLIKPVPVGSNITKLFEVGTRPTDSTNVYTPVSVTFGAVSTTGTVTATTVVGDHPNIGTSLIHPSLSANRYWTLTNGGMVFDTCAATFTFVAADLDAGATPTKFFANQYNGSAWQGVANGVDSVRTAAATSTKISPVTSFGDFILGQLASSTTYTITTTATSGGSVSPAGTTTVAQGDSKTFTIAPIKGYHIDSVVVDGINNNVITSKAFTNITANHTLDAYFSINKYTLSVTTLGNGTVDISPVQAEYDTASVITITATAGSGATFYGWTGSKTGTINPLIDTISANRVIVANFTGGTITSNGTGGGLWSAPATWAGGFVPTQVDSVVITGTDYVTVSTASIGYCHSMLIQSGATLRADTVVNARFGSLTVNGTVYDTLSGVVSAAGTITFGNGSLYWHARNAGTLPLATWSEGSTCMLTGVISGSPGNGSQNFYNFIWNNPGQTGGLNMAWDNIVIGGDVTCTASSAFNSATGFYDAQQFRMTSAATTRNITIKGNIIVNGGFITASGSSGAALYKVNVLGNIYVKSGKLGLCQGSGGYGNWMFMGDSLIVSSGALFNKSSNTTHNTRLIFCKKDGVQYYSNAGTNNNLSYGVDSNATVVLNSPLTVGDATTGALIVTKGKFTTTSTNLMTLGAGASIFSEYTATPSGSVFVFTTSGVKAVDAATVGYIDGPMKVTHTVATKVDSLPIGKGSFYRPIILNVTQDATTSTTYTAELFNAAPAERVRPFALDSISPVRYVRVTKGSGANVTSATINISYTTDDGIDVSNKDNIRIAMDTTGQWVNLGGSGTANNIGSISSNTFGTSTALGNLTTNDFVLAHVNPASIAVLATVTTKPATDVSTTFATSGGIISSDGNAAITLKGVCWNTGGSPTTANDTTIDGTTSTPFNSKLKSLTAGTQYHVRAYAVNSAGTAYGDEVTFSTLAALAAPTVTTDTVRNIVNTDAIAEGTVTEWGGSDVTDRGICWSTLNNPTIADEHNSAGTGSGKFTAPIGGLAYGTTYFVRAYATNSTNTSYGAEKSFTTPAAQATVYKIVAKDGTGHYSTIQAAFDEVPENYTGKWVIFVKNGTYTEKTWLTSKKINVVLIGEDRENTILTFDDYAGKNTTTVFAGGTIISNGTNTSFTCAIDAPEFQAQNITFRNTANAYNGSGASQAVALRTNGDRQSYYNCKMLGYQDTYYTQGGIAGPDRIYNKHCYIEGAVDFIFGRDVAVFDSCTIFTNRTGGVVTAAATESGFKFGYVFLNSTLASTPLGEAGCDGAPMVSFYLGRPWQAAPKTVYVNCYEPATVNAAGWTLMGPSPALYSEYGCSGPGALSSRPVIPSWTTNQPSAITAEEAATYTVANIFAKTTAAAPFAYSANWIPVKLEYEFPAGSPGFSANTTSLNLGLKLAAIETGKDSLVVSNSGTAELVISSIVSSDGRFVVEPTSATIPVSGSQKFYVTFAPDSGITIASKLIFTSNTAKGADTVALVGYGRWKIRDFRNMVNGSIGWIGGVVTRAYGKYTYVQDSTGGIIIYGGAAGNSWFDSVATQYVKPGGVYIFNGKTSEYKGLKEIGAATDLYYWQNVDTMEVPTPITLTLANIIADGEKYESVLIKVTDLQFVGASGSFAAATTYNIEDPTDVSYAVVLRVPNATDGDVDGLPIPTGKFIFTGVLGQYTNTTGGYQLMAILAGDVESQVGVDGKLSGVPDTYVLMNNFPNPFNPSTTIQYGLPTPSNVTIKVYSILGQEVATLMNGTQKEGYHSVVWNGNANGNQLAASGVYFLRITATSTSDKDASFTQVKKMLLMK